MTEKNASVQQYLSHHDASSVDAIFSPYDDSLQISYCMTVFFFG